MQYSQSGTNSAGSFVASGGATSSVTISGQQTIYDFGRTPAQIGQAQSSEISAQWGLQQTQQDVIGTVRQDYYTLLQDQRLVEVQRGNLKDQQAHLDIAEANFDVGLAPMADVYRAQAAVEQAKVTFTQALTTAAQARA